MLRWLRVKRPISQAPTTGAAGLAAASGLTALALPKCPLCLTAHAAFLASLGWNSTHLTWAKWVLVGVFVISTLVLIARVVQGRLCTGCQERLEPSRPTKVQRNIMSIEPQQPPSIQ